MGKGFKFRLFSLIWVAQALALAILVICCISAPVTSLGLAKHGDIIYGVFGACSDEGGSDSRRCSKPSSLYHPENINPMDDADGTVWTLPHAARGFLSHMLIVAPVAAGITLFAMILNFAAQFGTMGSNAVTFVSNLLFAVLGLISSSLICVVVWVLFWPQLAWCGILLVPAVVIHLVCIPLIYLAHSQYSQHNGNDSDCESSGLNGRHPTASTILPDSTTIRSKYINDKDGFGLVSSNNTNVTTANNNKFEKRNQPNNDMGKVPNYYKNPQGAARASQSDSSLTECSELCAVGGNAVSTTAAMGNHKMTSMGPSPQTTFLRSNPTNTNQLGNRRGYPVEEERPVGVRSMAGSQGGPTGNGAGPGLAKAPYPTYSTSSYTQQNMHGNQQPGYQQHTQQSQQHLSQQQQSQQQQQQQRLQQQQPQPQPQPQQQQQQQQQQTQQRQQQMAPNQIRPLQTGGVPGVAGVPYPTTPGSTVTGRTLQQALDNSVSPYPASNFGPTLASTGYAAGGPIGSPAGPGVTAIPPGMVAAQGGPLRSTNASRDAFSPDSSNYEISKLNTNTDNKQVDHSINAALTSPRDILTGKYSSMRDYYDDEFVRQNTIDPDERPTIEEDDGIKDDGSDFTSVSQRGVNPNYYIGKQFTPVVGTPGYQPAHGSIAEMGIASPQFVSPHPGGASTPQPTMQPMYYPSPHYTVVDQSGVTLGTAPLGPQPQYVASAGYIQGPLSAGAAGMYSAPLTPAMGVSAQNPHSQPRALDSADIILQNNPDFMVGGGSASASNSARFSSSRAAPSQPLSAQANYYKPAYKKRLQKPNIAAASLSRDSPYGNR